MEVRGKEVGDVVSWQLAKSGGEREAGEGVVGTSWGSGEDEAGRRCKELVR